MITITKEEFDYIFGCIEGLNQYINSTRGIKQPEPEEMLRKMPEFDDPELTRIYHKYSRVAGNV